MEYRVASVSSLIVYFGDRIEDEISGRVLSLYEQLKSMGLEGIVEIIPSYTTLYIEFDLFKYSHDSLFDLIKSLRVEMPNRSESDKIIEIPVYYGIEVGIDLDRVAKAHTISIDEVIKIHTDAIYRVHTIGFCAGFAYMGRVDKKIATPRLATPRSLVPKGSVAIANEQCAVYPMDTPGGWNILGRTPVEMFDISLKNFSYLKPGDAVKFVPIDKDEYLSLGGKI